MKGRRGGRNLRLLKKESHRNSGFSWGPVWTTPHQWNARQTYRSLGVGRKKIHKLDSKKKGRGGQRRVLLDINLDLAVGGLVVANGVVSSRNLKPAGSGNLWEKQQRAGYFSMFVFSLEVCDLPLCQPCNGGRTRYCSHMFEGQRCQVGGTEIQSQGSLE